jgi:hypothetical protein
MIECQAPPHVRVRGLDGMSLPWISLSPHELAENTAGTSYHSDGCVDIPVQPFLSGKSPLPADWSLQSLSLASIEQASCKHFERRIFVGPEDVSLTWQAIATAMDPRYLAGCWWFDKPVN